MKPLAVALNLVYLVEESGGAGRYARELIRSLLMVEPETRITVFVGKTAPESLRREDWAPEVEWVRFPVAGVGSPWRLVAEFAALPVLAARRGCDVLHGPANIGPLFSPRVPTVVTLLDLIWIHFPQTMARLPTMAMKVLAPACARRADRVIAISNAARDDLVATLGLPPEKIDVTPLGIRLGELPLALEEAEVRRRFRISPGPIVLSVAQKREHKNLAALVRAIAAIPEAQLVLPGEPTPYEQELRALAAELGIADRVHFPLWVSEEELEGLYAAARCFVLPSFIEGFGLPVLEAMRRDLPVACSNASSLPEVAADAALLFDPNDVEAITRSVQRLLTEDELVRDLVARGHERCRAFTWEETARLTLASYRRAHARSSSASRPPSPPS
jgi:glycosyltransferase involved in cell wall biosynthesis